ncbi:MAG: MBL fold metallo-hydrolase [Alphaproteobacteria bacterium]
MRFPAIIALAIGAFALLTVGQLTAARAEPAPGSIAEGFPVPPLHPEGTVLETRELAPGVYALVSNKPPTDNSGFVVGEKGVLVIDAHINGDMARQIQARVREVTDKPILYLVNTNYHGDHTFGNYAFPEDTRIIAHRLTAERMKDFEHEKILMLAAVDNDASILSDTRLRLPDVTFDKTMRIDLGGRIVELYHFGAGNTPGDTVVYVPEARVAWTGNLVLGEGIIPFLIEGGAVDYLATIARFAQTVNARTIIPGHAIPTTGAILGRYLAYLNDLVHAVRGARLQGHTLEEALSGNELPAAYVIPADSPLAAFAGFNDALHRWNFRVTYGEFAGG